MKTRTATAIFVGIMFVMLLGYAPKSSAELSVRIGINVPLPHVVLHTPPPVVVIPGTYAYFVPDTSVEIFFYHGYWYRPHHGHWYRARGYNGPWRNIRHTKVPHVLRDLPPDFHRTVRRHKRIQYADFKNNWKTWEKQKHWDRRVKRNEVRKVRHGGKKGISQDMRKAQDVRHGGKKGISQDMRKAQDVRHGGKKGISQDMREAKNVRHGGKKEINHNKLGGKEKYKN